MGRERVFRFKQFSLKHAKSAMKVGTDAVSLGAWAPCRGRVLDVGCGCGIIGIMAAQRGADSVVMIDVDSPSAEEAAENAANCPWAERITVRNEDFLNTMGEFDAILSNPPYFASGILAPDSRRATARHEGTLSPDAFMRKAASLLAPNGVVSIIIPPDRLPAWQFAAELAGLYTSVVCSLLTKADSLPRRLMVSFVSRLEASLKVENLAIDSMQYHLLTEEFYL